MVNKGNIVKLVIPEKVEGQPVDSVPQMLRKLADEIDSGEKVVEGMTAVTFSFDEGYVVYGWGKDCETVAHAYFYMNKGSQILLDM